MVESVTGLFDGNSASGENRSAETDGSWDRPSQEIKHGHMCIAFKFYIPTIETIDTTRDRRIGDDYYTRSLYVAA